MKWSLDDNARSALHYLVLGLLLAGVPAGLLDVYDRWHAGASADGTLPLGIFHNGYLWFDGNRAAVADTTRAERLAYACVIPLGLAASIAIPLLLARSRWAWPVGRWVFLAAFAWCVSSALWIPHVSARVRPGLLEIRHHRVLVGDITLPFSGSTTLLSTSGGDPSFRLLLDFGGLEEDGRMMCRVVRNADTLLFAASDLRRYGPSPDPAIVDRASAHLRRMLQVR